MIKNILFLALLLFGCTACEDFLEVKPDKQLAIPTDKLENLLALLDNTSALNQSYPATPVIAADNLYLHSTDWQGLSSRTAQQAYVWERDVFNDSDRNDWTLPYNVIFIANLVLEGTDKLSPAPGEEALWNTVRGSALFHRAHAQYWLLQVFAPAYDPATASQSPGIVLRRVSDINAPSSRATVAEGYRQVLQDLEEAAALLPDLPAHKTRPSRAAALALLSRVHLQMGQSEKALSCAQQALQLQPQLLDFNMLHTAAAYPFPRFHEEVIFHNTIMNLPGMSYPAGKVDTALYRLYQPDDLRREAFFRYTAPDDIGFKGSYHGSAALFGGLATDELYLTMAESHARLGHTQEALAALNSLLGTRWRQGTFTPYTAEDADAALALILEERRKELPFRGLRWGDLRRLNREERFARELTRTLNGTTYSLPPGDPRYVLPIPQKVIESGGMAQNP
ncbi:RagB/SusD family nutrient uptake outer membrane protein [Pontibacter litorisediminis]|uniref:RagB/SusD family nutrient uptake outer membrane protein n=1 Tax=Pontibacter litorisediminis TaxID=1846260 RepID=UPI0023ED958F|nr:RagB/SusD family nutrient uptake outer membrane protein [Pontibacter litorisediminis]